MMTPDMLACNAVGGFSRDFWAEIDNQVLQLRDQEVGMEIVNDLIGVQTVLPVVKPPSCITWSATSLTTCQ
ncbi:gp9 [Enterobacter cloacae]|uniref:Gp9 n=1 Tax=Enterobacter cloacae TaxID=550 RepID=A0A377M692_ENTCL|nr:gp9 [Enterobacter cloacae]